MNWVRNIKDTPCKVCGTLFTPDHPARKTCSEDCKAKARQRVMRSFFERHGKKIKEQEVTTQQNTQVENVSEEAITEKKEQ